jgi:hypothetical protein
VGRQGLEPWTYGLKERPEHNANAHDSGKQAGSDTRDDTNEHRSSPEGAPGELRIDPVEEALTKALEGATAAGQWTVVAQLARELEARRLARQSSAVVSMDAARAKRNGGRS